VGQRLIGTFTDQDYITSQLLQIVKPYDPSVSKHLLGILNSTLLAYYFRKKYNRQDKTFPEIRIYELRSLPICGRHGDDPATLKVSPGIDNKVGRVLSLHDQLNSAQTPTDKTAIQRQINATDRQIDQLVYELYGLTDDEIKIVEEATQS
jgi:hypothetical protein